MTIPPSQPTRKDGTYPYNEDTTAALRRAISEERFATYLVHRPMELADAARALQLYARNIALGSAFHGPLQALEVTLRNAAHDSLNRLRTLRNRVVHHEPILQRDLRADHRWIVWLLERLSPETASWVAHHSRAPDILDLSSTHMRRF